MKPAQLSAAASGGAAILSMAVSSILITNAVQAQSSEGSTAQITHDGELLPPEAIGQTIVEGWDAVLARQARMPATGFDHRRRNGAQGEWTIPSRDHQRTPHSGEHYAVNKWGDPRMGIGFGREVDLLGAWFIGQEDKSGWPTSIVVAGFRDGVEIARTAPFSAFSDEPTWFGMKLSGIDRIEILAEGLAGNGGVYGMDDLTFLAGGERVVVDFEQMNFHDKLAGSGYAGLDWEMGTGAFTSEMVHTPLSPEPAFVGIDDSHATYGGAGTSPTLVSAFQGPATNNGTVGAVWVPPDTCGAVGVNHFVTVVNSNISVYVKATGARVVNSDLNAFLAGDSWGDPRVTFDKTSQKFIVLATDFQSGASGEVSIAISNTSDPTGAWTKATFNPNQGVDAGKFLDYPTLGCNKDFIVTCAYMVGGSNLMTVFAIDKQNFINTGALTVTAFRSLPWEGAIHGATTWDNAASQYLVSRAGNGLRIRRLNLPANAPTLTELGIAVGNIGTSPPSAPQLGGGSVPTLDGRFMNAVWVNGSIWTANGIASNGKAGCRWYQVDTTSITLVQTGTVDDASLYFFMPGIAVNSLNQVVMTFSGCNSGQFAGAYFSGRLASDPAGQMGPAVQYKAGLSRNNDGRWGDYALTSVDPTDESTFWTAQEYAESNNSWGVYIAQVHYDNCAVSNYCTTSANSVGSGSVIGNSGSTSVAANDFGVFASFNPPNQNGIFFMGPNQQSTAFGNGVLCVAGALTRYPVVQSDSFGIAVYSVDNTVAPAQGKIVSGSTWNWQYWYRDPMGGGAFFNLSDGLNVTYCP